MAALPQPSNPILQKPPGFAGKPLPRPPNRSNYHFRPRKRQSHCCRTCCCIFFIIFLILLFVFVILAGVMYLLLEPKMPEFHLQSFQISRFAVTTRDDGTYFDAAATARMEVKNPNAKLTYRYGESLVEVSAGKYGETDLGSASVPAFKQRPENATSLKIQTSVKNKIIEDGLGGKLKSDYRTKNLAVNIRVKTKIGVAFYKIEIGMLSVDVYCDNIKLKKIEGGIMPKCTIQTFNWITVY